MRIIYFISIILLPAIVSAQETWDLEKCINYAIEHSIDIQQADLSVADAEVVQKVNEQQRMPSLSGNISAFTNFGRTIDPTSNAFVTSTFLSNNYGVNLGIMLFNGGRLKNNIKQSKIDREAFATDKASMIASVSLNVVTAYFEALLATDNLTNAQIQVKTNDDQIDQMQKLVSAGSRAQFEIYDLEAQLASSEQQLTLAQNRIDLAMLSLKGFMNLDPSTEMSLSVPPMDQLTYTDLDATPFEEIYKNVVGTRPELKALDLRIRSGEIGVEIAKSAYYPTITAGGNLSTNYSNQAKEGNNFVTQFSPPQSVLIDNNPSSVQFEQTFPTSTSQIPYFTQVDNNFSYGFGIQASIPILNNYNAKGNTARARIGLENLKANKDKFIIDLRNLLGQFLTDAKAAKRNLEASDKVLAARQIAFDNAEKRFNLGAINSFDYISIQDQLNTARTDQILAKYDYMMKIKILDFYQGFPVTLK